jgi:putative membrane protein
MLAGASSAGFAMLTEVVLAYLHFAAIFTLVWFLAKEWTLLRAGHATLDVRRLALADMGYGLASVGVIATGVARLAFGAKPFAFYLKNPVFHAKIGLFVLVGLVSIAPTLRILAWRRAVKTDAAFRPDEASWRRVRRWVMIELHGIALIPLLAVMMARAIGYSP